MSGNDPNKNNNNKKDEEDDKKKENNYYVGNGQAVMAPPPRDDRPRNNNNNNNDGTGDTLSSLFAKARNPNEKPPEGEDNDGGDAELGAPPAPGEAFSGIGRRLGFNADTPSPAVDDGRPVQVTIRVTFYRNGFTIDDGPLLDPKSGEGKEILEAFDKGIVPQSISGKHPRRAKFDVHLIKKEKEDYVKQFAAFEGAGHSLNSNNNQQQASASSAVPAVALTISPDAPRGRVLLQMPDGTRRRVDTNPTVHTVSELFGEAAVATGVSTSRISLTVREGPGRTVPLEMSDKRTLKDAKVDGAAVFVAISNN